MEINHITPYKIKVWDSLFREGIGILKKLREIQGKRLVVDTISTAATFIDHMKDVRLNLYSFIDLMKNADVTTIMTSEVNNNVSSLSRFSVEEYIVDGIIHLQYLPSELKYEKILMIEKMRGTVFPEIGQRYKIGEQGIEIIKNRSW